MRLRLQSNTHVTNSYNFGLKAYSTCISSQNKFNVCLRNDEVTAQRVEVALVFQQMLGTPAAFEYLLLYNVPFAVAHRVLTSDISQRRAETSFRCMSGLKS